MSYRESAVLTAICVVSGLVLFAVHSLTEKRIEGVENSKMARLLSEIFASADFREENGIYLAVSRENGELLGYIARAEGRGYGGTITLLVGVTIDGRVKKVRVLSHSETPGLGARIAEEDFLSQFENRTVDKVLLRREGGEIDAVSGATISSRGVVNAVREKMLELSHLWGSSG
jgi:electron transport complex protein RnfG